MIEKYEKDGSTTCSDCNLDGTTYCSVCANDGCATCSSGSIRKMDPITHFWVCLPKVKACDLNNE
jgi:hypothetical protein